MTIDTCQLSRTITDKTAETYRQDLSRQGNWQGCYSALLRSHIPLAGHFAPQRHAADLVQGGVAFRQGTCTERASVSDEPIIARALCKTSTQ